MDTRGNQELRLLVVEDEEVDRQMIERSIKKADVAVELVFARTGLRGQTLAASEPFDCVILDYRLPDMDALEFLRRAPEHLPIVVLTGMHSPQLGIRAIEAGAQDFLYKDVDMLGSTRLIGSIRYAIHRHSAMARQARAVRDLERAKLELEAANAVQRCILDSIGEGVIVVDPAGNFLLYNKHAEKLLGMGPAESPDSWVRDYGFYRADRTTRYQADDLPLMRALGGELVRNEEIFIQNEHRPDGVDLAFTASPLHNAEGEIFGAVGVFRDVSRFKGRD